jgi:hypothetical protein
MTPEQSLSSAQNTVGVAINGYVTLRCHRLATDADRKGIEALVGVLFSLIAVYSERAS